MFLKQMMKQLQPIKLQQQLNNPPVVKLQQLNNSPVVKLQLHNNPPVVKLHLLNNPQVVKLQNQKLVKVTMIGWTRLFKNAW